MADYFKSNGLEYKPVVFEKSEEMKSAYDAGRCDAYSSDISGLYVQRKLLAQPDEHIILPEVISKEPLGPLVQQEDPVFKDLASWTHFCMVNAEEYGVSKANVEAIVKSNNPSIRRLLGLEANGAKKLGVSSDFCYKIIKHIGNYGEVYDRNVSKDSPLNLILNAA